MKKQMRKKLTLAKETLVQLQDGDRTAVVGGGSGMDTCSCNCTGDCVTYWGPPCGPLYPY